MSLISVFYPLRCEGQPYTKAIVPGSAVPFFIAEFGFYKTQAEAIAALSPQADPDADPCGDPGQDSEPETDPDEVPGDDEDPDELQAGGAESYVDSGDEGCGAPGSKTWFLAQIKQARTKQSILDVVKNATGKSLTKKEKKGKRVDELKSIAIDLVERCFNGNG